MRSYSDQISFQKSCCFKGPAAAFRDYALRGDRFGFKALFLDFMRVSMFSLGSGSIVALLFFAMLFLIIPANSFAETSHRVYFKGTNSELDVYTITGSSPGPTLLILGGIQGDEPGGYWAADLYADMSLKKGNMIIVPRANFLSIVENARGGIGDMNRKFA